MTSVQAHRRFKRRLLQKIRQRSGAVAADSITVSLVERERNRFLGSHAVQCATLHEIWREEVGAEAAQVRWDAAQRAPVVPRDYRRFRGSPVEWYHKPRRTTGCRKICQFGDVEKMWHVLARELIVAQHRPRPHVGDWIGRGRDWQMGQLLAAINSPWQGVVCADIRRAFASVNIDAVYDLPFLPEPLIRRAIDYRTHQFVRRERSALAREVALVAPHDLEVAPSGLMEGSPASNAIFSVLLDDLPDHLGERIQAFTYCDNIVLLAPSMLHAQQAEIALVRYLTSHRAGPFEAISSVQSVCEPFEHLGYTLQYDQGGRLAVELSQRNWNRLGERLDDEQVDLTATAAWLASSFRHCSSERVGEYVQRLADEAAHRRAL